MFSKTVGKSAILLQVKVESMQMMKIFRIFLDSEQDRQGVGLNTQEPARHRRHQKAFR